MNGIKEILIVNAVFIRSLMINITYIRDWSFKKRREKNKKNKIKKELLYYHFQRRAGTIRVSLIYFHFVMLLTEIMNKIRYKINKYNLHFQFTVLFVEYLFF